MKIFNFLKRKKEKKGGGFAIDSGIYRSGTFSSSPLTVPVVLACVKMLSEDIGRVPFFVARKHTVYKEKIQHTINEILAMPNEKETAMSLKMQIISAMLLWGQSFLYVERSMSGKPLSIRCIHPSLVFEKLIPNTNKSIFIINQKSFAEEEILRIMSFSEYSNSPQSIIKLMSHWMKITQLSEYYAMSFLENMARPSMMIENTNPNSEWTKAERDAVQEEMQQRMKGKKKAGEIIVLAPNLKATAMSMQSDDVQMINSRKFQMQHLAAVLRIPMHKLGETAKTSYNNVHEMTISYARDALAPIAEMVAQALTRRLLSAEEKRKELTITYDMAALYNGDPMTMNTIYKDAFYAGGIYINEYRNFLGLPSIAEGNVTYQKNQQKPKDKEKKDTAEEAARSTEKRSGTAFADEEKITLYIEEMRTKVQAQFEAAADWESFYKSQINFDDNKEYVNYWVEFGERNTDEALGLTAAREMSEESIKNLSTKFTSKYKQGFEARMVMSSKNKIKKIKDATDSGLLEKSAAAAQLKEIIKKGSKEKAMAELNRAKNAIKRNTWIDAGVQRLRVKASGEPCEFCELLNGIEFSIYDPIMSKGEGLTGASGSVLTSTGNKYHPPFHGKCRCEILPA